MEQTAPLIHEIQTRLFHFEFYKEYFTCQYKMNFRKHSVRLFYESIVHIEQKTTYINFIPCYEYKIYTVNEKKPTVFCANGKKPLATLIEAMNFIGVQRSKIILEKIAKISSSNNQKTEAISKPIYCRYCGKTIKEDSVFCAYCGKTVQ